MSHLFIFTFILLTKDVSLSIVSSVPSHVLNDAAFLLEEDLWLSLTFINGADVAEIACQFSLL